MGHHDVKRKSAARKLRGLLSRLGADDRAAAALEFGLVVLPFMALMTASLQTSVVAFVQQNLESAVETTSRQVLTGKSQKAATSQTAFKALACSNLPAFMTCSNLFVSVVSYSSYGSADLSQPTITYVNGKPVVPTPFDMGNPGDIVVIRMMYPWTVENGPLGFTLATLNNGQRMLTSTAVIKTELYS